MIVGRRSGPPELLVAGVVRGLVADAERVTPILEEFRPEAVALGVGPEELSSYSEHFVDARAEPLAPLLPTEQAEVHGIARFGDVQLPHAPFLAGIAWAHEHQVPVYPSDLDEEAYADLFATHIGYLELVRRTVAERRLAQKAPAAGSADEFVVDWTNTVGAGRHSREFEAARTASMASAIRGLGAGRRRIAVLVDRERFATLSAALP